VWPLSVTFSFLRDCIANTNEAAAFIFMTQFFLYYAKKSDEYHVDSIGSVKDFTVVRREEGQTDEEFRNEAIRVFDRRVAENNIADFEIVKTAHCII
jgi:hypothetical protein